MVTSTLLPEMIGSYANI